MPLIQFKFRTSTKTPSTMTEARGTALVLTIELLLALSCHSLSNRPPPVIIGVCTDIDCRLDGASDALRQLQKNAPTGVRVTGRACLGPCGDGPCAVVLDSEGKRVVQVQTGKVQGSLVPPELFGSNPRGVYEVRTASNVDQVVRIAADAAGIEAVSDGPIDVDKATDELVVTSTRQPYDRPRNERKVMQRLMQFLVLAGLYHEAKHENVESLQFGTAFILFLLSDLIMKEKVFTFVWQKITK